MVKLFQQNLDFNQKHNFLLYGEALEKLCTNISGVNTPNDSDQMPLYPNLPKDRCNEKCLGYKL